jgi:steroid delta-isomerase-like uncharacterized protein
VSTVQSIEKLGTALIDAFNTRDMNYWARLLADDFVASYPGARPLNREQARMYNEAFLPAFPDIKFEVQRVLVDTDCIVTHWTASGTHTGSLMMLSGQALPPTNRQASVPGVFIVEVRDGKIAREFSYWNQVELLTQLGLMPA